MREKISKKLRDAYREGRRSNAVYIELDGERVTLAEASRRRGLSFRVFTSAIGLAIVGSGC